MEKTKLNYLRRLRNSIINKEVANVKNVEKVLDVGCGPAILYPELLKESKLFCFRFSSIKFRQNYESK